jgi:hypothetical protein
MELLSYQLSTKILYAFFVSPMCAPCPANIDLLDFIAITRATEINVNILVT